MDVVYSAARRRHSLLLAVALLGGVSALEAQATGDPAYQIGPDDEIAIEVLEDQALNVARRVSARGTVTLPLIGEIAVGDRTVDVVAGLLKTRLEASYLQLATVDVRVTQFRSRPISVIGAVTQPGTQYLNGRWSLLRAITAAGGTTEDSAGTALIRRRSATGLTGQLEVDLDGLINRGDPTWNVPVFANDVITIPARAAITVYFLGEVGTQGAVKLEGTERPTLLTAIARAGGLGERAASKLVVRRDRDGDPPLEIVANFRKILAGTEADIELEDGDFIVVKAAFL